MHVATLALETAGIWRRLRASEKAASFYFLYVSVLAAVLPLSNETRLRVWCVNLLLGGLFVYLSLGRSPESLRDWLPAPLILLAYKEMGWLARPHFDIKLETSWVQWDRLVLGQWGAKTWIESAGPWIPGFLELCYLLVYAMLPVSIALATIYARGRVEQLTFPLLVTCLVTYGMFPFFPSEPPRTVFPTDLVPAYQTVFRQLNWYICGGYGIHTSVFPSGHVSSAIAASIGIYRLMPERRWAWGTLSLVTAGIFVATIYGRYHYLVDSVAGAVVAVAVLSVMSRLSRQQG
jgi:membrane-associated phospholipid phosphatase